MREMAFGKKVLQLLCEEWMGGQSDGVFCLFPWLPLSLNSLLKLLSADVLFHILLFPTTTN